jgi:four helix bundle protein
MLIAQEVASQLIRALRSHVEQIGSRDGALADQLRRAGTSVLLNIAEGARRVGKDRAHHHRIAAGSAAEVAAALEIAAAWGYVAESALGEARSLVDRELGLLFGLTRHRT